MAYEYLKLYPKDDITAKIQRMETLSQTNVLRPSLNNIILAELATEAGLWGKAKAEIEMFLINNPATKKLAGMISKYEKFSNNDKKEAAKWKEKEASCADDAMWVCDECGHASADGKPFVRTVTLLARAIGGSMSKKPKMSRLSRFRLRTTTTNSFIWSQPADVFRRLFFLRG